MVSTEPRFLSSKDATKALSLDLYQDVPSYIYNLKNKEKKFSYRYKSLYTAVTTALILTPPLPLDILL